MKQLTAYALRMFSYCISSLANVKLVRNMHDSDPYISMD